MEDDLAQAMQDDGVDLHDPAAVQQWLAAFNDRPFAERDAFLGASLPRSSSPDAA